MKQLEFVIGSAAFQKSLQTYLAEHRYGNAQWSDLIHAFERASGQNLTEWATAYIEHRGMPHVNVTWTCNGDKLESLGLSQSSVFGDGQLWPISTEIALGYPNGTVKTFRAQSRTAQVQVPLSPVSSPCPAYVFANHRDFAYGSFPLDARSREHITEHIGSINDSFARTPLWGSLWQSVRDAEYAPKAYLQLALANLPSERDESLAANIIGYVEAALHRYIPGTAERNALSGKLQKLAVDRLKHEPVLDLRIVWFHALAGVAQSTEGREALRSLLDGKTIVPGVELRQQDRWGLGV